MVQTIENGAWLTCVLEGVRSEPDHEVLAVVLESAVGVDHLPNLLQQFAHQHVVVQLNGNLSSKRPGTRFVVRAQLKGNLIWADAAKLTLLGG